MHKRDSCIEICQATLRLQRPARHETGNQQARLKQAIKPAVCRLAAGLKVVWLQNPSQSSKPNRQYFASQQLLKRTPIVKAIKIKMQMRPDNFLLVSEQVV